ncbi:MAG: DUF362 domain-containing protein [Desulfovibrio sp.]|jgi:uncharacterized Fe-S center protein|nr:DUF362 domain-containing protein [Desulfovibrio sp.]
MSASPVYFTDMRCTTGVSLQDKLDRLIGKAGIEQIEFVNKFTAVKIHFGEPGNLSFLRPNFAFTVVKRVRALGGIPFLTDCNTLYVGRRNNAPAHLDAACENGYSPLSVGCQILIADGLKGLDEVDVPVPGGILLQSAKIGRAIMDADVFISLNHFKGHELTGFGGAIKNTGMGSGSRAGKMIMHNSGKPEVSAKRCTGCRTCSRYCAQSAISFNEARKAVIDHARCVGCGRCLGVCNYNAIFNRNASSNDDVNRKMAEYALAVLHGRPNFHINVVNQVSPYCDCHSENDAAVVPDIGIFASFDPVALDKACIDAVNAAPVVRGTLLEDRGGAGGEDHFHCIHPSTDWRGQIEHAEKIGLGSGTYNLVTVK